MNNEFDSLIKKMVADHQPELPSPGVIWWRVQILEKAGGERTHCTRPLPSCRVRSLLAWPL